jgi:hypothetical protein
MPAFSQHLASPLIKAMITGESKSGKTGLLATLANSDQIDRMVIFDFDNGLDILGAYLTPAAVAKITYKTFDRFDAGSYQAARELIKHWKTPSEDLGPLKAFGPRDVVVMDSGTFFGDACMEAAKKKNGIDKDTQIPQAVWGDGQSYFMKVVDAFTSDKLPCNLIWNTHIRMLEDPIRKTMKGFPETVGSKLSGRIARSFNNLWLVESKLDGKRVIRTQANSFMTLGSSAPTVLAAEEDFDLGKIFKKIREASASKLATAAE